MRQLNVYIPPLLERQIKRTYFVFQQASGIKGLTWQIDVSKLANLLTEEIYSMRELNTSEIQSISGAGIIAAVTLFPAVAMFTLGTTIPAILVSPLVAVQGKTLYEGLKNAAYQSTLGLQIGWSMEKALYNW